MPKRPDPDYPCPYAEPPAAPLQASPLEIILDTMRRKYGAGDLDGAVAIARIAAPYLHARIPAATPATELAAVADADLDTVQDPE